VDTWLVDDVWVKVDAWSLNGRIDWISSFVDVPPGELDCTVCDVWVKTWLVDGQIDWIPSFMDVLVGKFGCTVCDVLSEVETWLVDGWVDRIPSVVDVPAWKLVEIWEVNAEVLKFAYMQSHKNILFIYYLAAQKNYFKLRLKLIMLINFSC
jgi:hypothetical protein